MWGVPLARWGVPPAWVPPSQVGMPPGGGTPSQVGGTPFPGRGTPFPGGVIPFPGGVPPLHGPGKGVPPAQTWEGATPYPDLGRGTPLPPQMVGKVKTLPSVILQMRAVIRHTVQLSIMALSRARFTVVH